MSTAFIVRPYDLGTLTASTSGSPAVVANLNNDYLGLYWSGSDTCWVQADLGSSLPVNFVSMLNTFVSDTAMTVRVRGKDASNTTVSPTYDSGTAAIVPVGTPANLNNRYHSFTELASTQTLRYWRMDLTTGFLAATRLVIGKKLQTTFNVSYGETGVGTRWLGSTEFTNQGGLFFRDGRRLRSVTLSYPFTTDAELWNDVLPFFAAKTVAQNHLLVCLDGAFSTARMGKMFFGAPTSDFGSIVKAPNGWAWKLTVEGPY